MNWLTFSYHPRHVSSNMEACTHNNPSFSSLRNVPGLWPGRSPLVYTLPLSIPLLGTLRGDSVRNFRITLLYMVTYLLAADHIYATSNSERSSPWNMSCRICIPRPLVAEVGLMIILSLLRMVTAVKFPCTDSKCSNYYMGWIPGESGFDSQWGQRYFFSPLCPNGLWVASIHPAVQRGPGAVYGR